LSYIDGWPDEWAVHGGRKVTHYVILILSIREIYGCGEALQGSLHGAPGKLAWFNWCESPPGTTAWKVCAVVSMQGADRRAEVQLDLDTID
jgi:hypothetical protein